MENNDSNMTGFELLKCAKCGASLRSGANFCSQCGSPLTTECAFCGAKVGSADKFCSVCGKELASLPKSPAKDFVYVEAGSTGMRSFFICAHQVTQEEYERTMGRNPSNFTGARNPVENVSWYDCLEYCNRRSLSEGLKAYYNIAGDDTTCNEDADGYRLPTEAEWEYAARGGSRSHGYEYSGSNNIEEVAWYKTWDCDDYDDCDCDDCPAGGTHPVCMKEPNELGLYDMSGNVWEWCWDRPDSSALYHFWRWDRYNNPSGSFRVFRGGNWRGSADSCSVSYWDYWNPSDSFNYLGFRLARSAKD